VNPTSTDAQFQQSLSQEAKENVAKSQRDINPGRVTAQMQQDTHPIQGTFRELAEATGGRALRRASDIAAELNGIVNDGRAAYQFSFSPQQPADDQYHHITVQVVQHPGISLRFRTGYFYASEPTSPRDKFRLAVWEPQDASEIALTATHEHVSGHGVLRLNISAPDLAFQTQGGFKTDKLYIFLVARNDSAMRARVTGQTLGMRLRPDTYERTLYDGIPFEQPIDLKPDDDSVRLIVIDANSNRIGSITLPATSLR
jgi:hypothetical protein